MSLIQLPKRKKNVQISYPNLLKGIAGKLAEVLYDKSLGECLGSPQQIKKKGRDLECNKLRIQLPNFPDDPVLVKELETMKKKKNYGKVEYPYFCKELDSMINHAKKEHIDVTIEYVDYY